MGFKSDVQFVVGRLSMKNHVSIELINYNSYLINRMSEFVECFDNLEENPFLNNAVIFLEINLLMERTLQK